MLAANLSPPHQGPLAGRSPTPYLDSRLSVTTTTDASTYKPSVLSSSPPRPSHSQLLQVYTLGRTLLQMISCRTDLRTMKSFDRHCLHSGYSAAGPAPWHIWSSSSKASEQHPRFPIISTNLTTSSRVAEAPAIIISPLQLQHRLRHLERPVAAKISDDDFHSHLS